MGPSIATMRSHSRAVHPLSKVADPDSIASLTVSAFLFAGEDLASIHRSTLHSVAVGVDGLDPGRSQKEWSLRGSVESAELLAVLLEHPDHFLRHVRFKKRRLDRELAHGVIVGEDEPLGCGDPKSEVVVSL